MNGRKKEGQRAWNTPENQDFREIVRWIVLLIVLMEVAGGLITNSIKSYQVALLDSQKGQLINVAKSVAAIIELYRGDCQNMARGITKSRAFQLAERQQEEGSPAAMQQLLEENLAVYQEDIVCLSYRGRDGKSLSAGDDRGYVVHRDLGSSEALEDIAIVKAADGTFYFRESASSEDGGVLYLYLPMTTVYTQTTSGIQMGANGYVMIKDSGGVILMHPVKEQIGLNVISGRQEEYPDLDLSELKTLVQHQLAGRSGVEVYHSYWWANNPPTRTRKVSAYVPVRIGRDFLCVSAVMDYSEILEPAARIAIRILIAALTTTIFLIVLIRNLIKGIQSQRQTRRENEKLLRINEEQEKLRKQSEINAQQQRLQLIGTMTSGIAHEFNNLLTPIMGYSGLMLSGMTPEDENYDDVKEIYSAAEKAKEIINQISQFSRKNAQQMMEPVHVAEVTDRALVITEAAKPKNITLERSISPDRDLCQGNEIQIYQIIINLCNNAMQAMKEDGGTLTVTAAAVQAGERHDEYFRGRPEQWFYRISVRDTGCGMTQEEIDQIFIPFYTTKRPGEGTGLGLAIVQRLVDAHSGHICVHSQIGKGSEFVVYFPVLPQTENAGEESAEA